MNASFPEKEPLVSIITLNYNQAQVTREFLESSKSLNYRNYEILVCDMASSISPETAFRASDYPNTRLLLSYKNLGFSGGNNWGIRQAKGDFIFIVNNDTELTPDLIRLMLQPFYESPAIGVVCPKIKYFEHPDVIQYAGFRPMNRFTGRTATVGDMEQDVGQYPVSGPTYAAHGCAMMVKKEVIEKTGLFPEKFFLYYEEWDWSARIQKAGYIIWYQAAATIYHKVSLSVGKDNPVKVYYHARNRILFMRRNSNPLQLLVFFLFFTFFSMPKAIISFLLNGQFLQIKWFLKGVGYNLVHSSASVEN
ncbi:MAG: glycosyltransferase family 2 protein [Bacteroidota bacterium]|nr:glycosyltransferase family 2 protein [Bacteroidota bacterium]